MNLAQYLNRVTDRESAIAFLESLADCGLLFHPDDSAADCLQHHRLAAWSLEQIQRNMNRARAILPDICETALAILNRETESNE